MRVGFFEVKDWERTFFAERLAIDEIYFESGLLPVPDVQLRELEALSVFIYSHMTRVLLDVLEGEELIKEERQLLQNPVDVGRLRTALRNRVLLARDNVVFTPHNAFNSREALVRILEVTLSNLEAFRAGQPVHRVA
jgi:lactate dehydrogenase-like 2-hydroxyacid dehydrogenase